MFKLAATFSKDVLFRAKMHFSRETPNLEVLLATLALAESGAAIEQATKDFMQVLRTAQSPQLGIWLLTSRVSGDNLSLHVLVSQARIAEVELVLRWGRIWQEAILTEERRQNSVSIRDTSAAWVANFVNCRNKTGRTPLMLACKGDGSLMQLLLKSQADPCCVDRTGRSALHYAAIANYNANICRILIDTVSVAKQTSFINMRDKKGTVPLCVACFFSATDVIHLLLDRGANPKITNKEGCSVLHGLAEGVQDEYQIGLASLLLDKGVDVLACSSFGSTVLHEACRVGHVKLVQELIEWKQPHANNSAQDWLSVGDSDGLTALHVAVNSSAQNTVGCVRLLLSCSRVDSNACDEMGMTPLHQLSWHLPSSVNPETMEAVIEKCRLLLQFGGDPTLDDHTQWTCLHKLYAIVGEEVKSNVVMHMQQDESISSSSSSSSSSSLTQSLAQTLISVIEAHCQGSAFLSHFNPQLPRMRIRDLVSAQRKQRQQQQQSKLRIKSIQPVKLSRNFPALEGPVESVISEHWGVACAVCSSETKCLVPTDLLVGTRYECLECPQLTLCSRHCHQPFKDHSGLHTLVPFVSSGVTRLDCSSLATLIQAIFHTFAARPCVGLPVDASHKSYKWITYAELWTRARNLAKAFAPLLEGDGEEIVFVALSLSNSLEWVLVDLCCAILGVATIPLYPEASSTAAADVLLRCRPKLVVCRRKEISKFSQEVQSSQGDPEEACILLRQRQQEQEEKKEEVENCVALSLGSLEAEGCTLLTEPFINDHSDSLFTLFNTSGSMGEPKLVNVTRGSLLKSLSIMHRNSLKGDEEALSVKLIFSSLAHSGSRNAMWALWLFGGQLALFIPQASSRPVSVLEAAAHLHPTMFFAPPSVWLSLHQEYVRRGSSPEVLAEMRAEFKGLVARIRGVGTGSAPCPKFLFEWVEELLGLPLHEGYGITEVGSLASDGQIHPGMGVELRDVPELGYMSSDLPHPRGEICVRDTSQFEGYYRDEQATAEVLTSDGLYRTGDVGERLPDGTVHVIDRLKTVAKLGNGKFVALQSLENLYLQCPSVAQICLCVDETLACLVAIVVPSLNVSDLATTLTNNLPQPSGGSKTSEIAITSPEIKEPLAEMKGTASLDNVSVTLLQTLSSRQEETDVVKQRVVAELAQQATIMKLSSHEVPRVIVLAQEFTILNQCLTPSGKLCRRYIVKTYSVLIQQAIASTMVQATSGGKNSVEWLGIVGMLEASLQNKLPEEEETIPLLQLGFDSMQIAQLAMHIRSTHKISLSVVQVSSAETLKQLKLLIQEAKLSGASMKMPSVSPVAPLTSRSEPSTAIGSLDAEQALTDLNSLQDHENDSDRQIITDITDQAAPLLRSNASRIFLTGVTGFCGVHLLVSLLRLNNTCQVICLVRQQHNCSALEKLIATAAAYRVTLNELDLMRVVCVAGDLSQPKFGLSNQQWLDLGHSLDFVVHCGASVNWSSSYASLRPSNVLGTFEILNLCKLRGSWVPMVYISTIGNRSGDDITVPLHSDTLIHCSAYAKSKLIAEEVVRRKIINGAPFSIIRPGLITWNSSTGACNPHDIMGRVLTGSCQLQLGFGVPSVQLDGIPVDAFASLVILLLSKVERSRIRCLTMLPPYPLLPSSAQLFRSLQQSQIAPSMLLVSYVEWHKAVCERALQTNPLFSLTPHLSPMRPPMTFADHACLVHQLAEECGFEWPLARSELVVQYLGMCLSSMNSHTI